MCVLKDPQQHVLIPDGLIFPWNEVLYMQKELKY
jgi:hypothetical protein